MKTVAIFGSTGSVGESALKVLSNNKSQFNLVCLSAHSNYEKLKKLKKKHFSKKIILTDKNLNKQMSLIDKNIILEKNLFKRKKKIDYVISGTPGYDALSFNLKLIKISKNLLIANKETIICGGNFFLNYAKKYKCNIIPIDSEHHCVHVAIKFLKNLNNVDKIYLVASGGPFLQKKIKYNEKIKNVVKHPNWKMGNKISVDSSTFANKILELFEAKILFNLSYKHLKIIVEEESNFHAILKLKNNIYLPIVHKPNMQIPIASSLDLPNKYDLKLSNMNVKFVDPDLKKFPIIKLGFKILKYYGHAGMIVFNVINDKLVYKFLKNAIKYGDISKFLINCFKKKYIRKMSKTKLSCLMDVKKFISKVDKIKL